MDDSGDPDYDPAAADSDDSVGLITGPHSSLSPPGLDLDAARLSGRLQKRARACDSCRGLKVRCSISADSTIPCSRCAKAARPCIVTPPARRRAKRQNDGRVADLERKVDALTAVLHARQGNGPGSDIRDTASPVSVDYVRTNSGPAESGSGEAIDPERANTMYENWLSQRVPRPIVDRKLLVQVIDLIVDRPTSTGLFDLYCSRYVPLFPAVPFAPGTKAEDVLVEKPILFLAVITATNHSSMLDRSVKRALTNELSNVLTNAMWKCGEKNLEIIQALQLACIWHSAIGGLEQMVTHHMTYMATLIALDIGIGKRPAPLRSRLMGDGRCFQPLGAAAESVECRRAWVICYFLSILVLVSLRRPLLVRFNGYMEDCIYSLTTDPDALASDRELAYLAKFLKVIEDVTTMFFLDDPTVSDDSLSDTKFRYSIQHFRKQISHLSIEAPSTLVLNIIRPFVTVYSNEISLRLNLSNEPAMQEKLERRDPVHPPVAVNSAHVEALDLIQKGTAEVLNYFVSLEHTEMSCIPSVFYYFSIYSLSARIKLVYLSETNPEFAKFITMAREPVDVYYSQVQEIKAVYGLDHPEAPQSRVIRIIDFICSNFGVRNRNTEDSTTDEASRNPPIVGVPVDANVGPRTHNHHNQTHHGHSQLEAPRPGTSTSGIANNPNLSPDPNGNFVPTHTSTAMPAQWDGQPYAVGSQPANPLGDPSFLADPSINTAFLENLDVSAYLNDILGNGTLTDMFGFS